MLVELGALVDVAGIGVGPLREGPPSTEGSGEGLALVVLVGRGPRVVDAATRGPVP